MQLEVPSGEIIFPVFTTTQCIRPHILLQFVIWSHQHFPFSDSLHSSFISRWYDSSLLFIYSCGSAAGCVGLRPVDLGIQAHVHRQDHQALQKEVWHFTSTNPNEQPARPLPKHFPECLQTTLPGASGSSGEQTWGRDLHLSPAGQEEQGPVGVRRWHPSHHAWGYSGFNLVGFSIPRA